MGEGQIRPIASPSSSNWVLKIINLFISNLGICTDSGSALSWSKSFTESLF